MFWSLALFALLSSAQGRAVNISNTWVLPEEGFPVFYRYFRDRISWYEADAVCQFHHANLVTVDTTAQYDAVRAYLKELDISSAVWVGLIRSNPDGDFTWTDYRGMSGDGYWSAAPDSRSAPLCAAADPAADYRWEARACGGPMVASFICELPVPQWASGSEGCMVRALPALTVLYLPESASVQLTTDCGLAGVKRVQCTGNVKRDKLLEDLSCPKESEESTTSIFSDMTTGTTDSITEQDNAQEFITEESVTTEREGNFVQNILSTANPTIINIEEKLNRIPLTKDIEYNNLLHDNNLESNDIPKVSNNDNNFISEEDSEKLEDEKNKQHKILHNELARQGNLGYFETIFSQPADHFVPPLVMAKAKMSDDMTVLSLEEKHAQQLAEHRVLKYKNNQEPKHKAEAHMDETITTEKVSLTESTTIVKQAAQSKDLKDIKNYKYGPSKKYYEKYGDAKAKNIKIQGKAMKYAEKVLMDTETKSTLKYVQLTSTMAPEKTTPKNVLGDDSSMDLSVIINEPKVDAISTVNPISLEETSRVQTHSILKEKNDDIVLELTTSSNENMVHQNFNQSEEDMSHEVIKITILNDKHPSATPTVFEVTTRLPVSESSSFLNERSTAVTQMENITDDASVSQESIVTTGAVVPMSSISHSEITSKLPILVSEAIALTEIEHNAVTVTNENTKESSTTEKLATTTFTPITDATSVTKQPATPPFIKESSPIKIDASATTEINLMNDTVQLNSTEFHEEEFEILHDNDEEGLPPASDSIDDFQSPLLSAASEPLHRPARSRRPTQQHKKFNPFRILG